jgi:hypothetical protein
MRNSKVIFWPGLILAGCSLGVLCADNLTLVGDARLSGTVRSINEAGVVELVSALSPEPIELKADAVEKVEFSAPAPTISPPGTRVELVNGDLLPVTIECLDAKNLTVLTADAGRLLIPRSALKSMQLGVHSQNVIYRGPKNLEEWNRDLDSSKAWSFANNALTTNRSALGWKNFETPPQFILKFTLKWQGEPSFKIYFADPLTPQVDLVDRYYLNFSGAGPEIKRESSKGRHFQTVILSNRTPDQFSEKQLDVEIHVDRKTSRLHLFLNGEPEGAGVDPVADAPPGNGVTFINNSQAGLTQEISDIEILELDNAGARHHAEERGDPKVDSLISRDEDRWGGRLTEIHQGPQGPVFLFKSDFQDEPLELSERDVSTVFFANAEQTPAVQAIHPFALRLRGDGCLRVSSCAFSSGDVVAQHALLGSLKISRAGVTSLERLSSKPEVKSEP